MVGLAGAAAAYVWWPKTQPRMTPSVGDQREMSLDYHASGFMNVEAALATALPQQGGVAAATPDTAQAVDIALTGKWVTTVVGEDAKGFALVAVLTPSAVRFATGAVDHTAHLGDALGKPWHYRLGRDGRIEGLALPDDMGIVGRNMIRTILGLTRVSLPVDDVREWDIDETGVHGVLNAHYVRDGLNVKKTLKGASVTADVALVLDDETLQVVQADATQETGENLKGTAISKMTETLHLEAGKVVQRSAHDLAALQTSAAKGRPADLSGKDEIDRVAADRYRQIIQMTTLDATMAALAAASPRGQISALPAATIEALKAFVTLDPAAIGVVESRLLQDAARTLQFGVLAGVLGQVGTPECQETLARVARRRADDWDAASQAVAVLALVEKPTPATAADLTAMVVDAPSDELRRTSMLALGSVGGRMGEAHADVAEKIRGTIDRALRDAEARDDTDVALRALGNMGPADGLERVGPYLASGDATIRAVALRSLRFVPGTEPDRALVTSMSADRDDTVRAAAAEALSYRPITQDLLDGFQGRLEVETSEIVVQQVLKALGSAATGTPAARVMLEQYARTCGTQSLCNYADRLLAATVKG